MITYLQDMLKSFSWAWMDVKCRYRRSLIGPLWETLTLLFLIGGMGFISSAVFDANMATVIPYLGLGLIIWTLISNVVNESTMCFISQKEMLDNTNLGLGFYSGRLIFRHLINFGHHMLLYFIGLYFFEIDLGLAIFLAPLGLLFLFLNFCWLVPTIGMLVARFRDLEMVVKSGMHLTFFITPIFWNISVLNGNRLFLVEWNPIYYLIELLRAPLLGDTSAMGHYFVVINIFLSGILLFYFVHKKIRYRLAFYL